MDRILPGILAIIFIAGIAGAQPRPVLPAAEMTPVTGAFNQGTYTVTPGSGSFVTSSPGSITVTPGTGTWTPSALPSYVVTPGTGTFPVSGTFNTGSYTVTPGSGTWTQSALPSYTVTPGTGTYRIADSVTVTPGTGTWSTTASGIYTVTQGSGTVAPTAPWLFGTTSTSSAFTFTATGSSASITTTPFMMKSYAIQVKGTGAAASVWDIRLEGSLDNSNFTQILQHTNTTGDAILLFSGSTLSPSLYIRARTAGLTLGSATNVVVTVAGVQ